MTYGKIAALFLEYMNDPSGHIYTPERVALLINEAVRDIVSMIIEADRNACTACVNLVVPGGKRNYEAALPVDFESILSVKILETGGGGHPIYSVDQRDYESFLDERYYRADGGIGIHDTGSGFTLSILYTKSPGEMVKDDDTPSVIPELHHSLISLAAALSAYGSRGVQMPNALYSIYQKRLRALTITARRRAREDGPVGTYQEDPENYV